MGVLAVYDTVGIQNYIFASNKLSENVGGSKLVAEVFADVLSKAIESVTAQKLPDWRDCGVLDPELIAEIIYQGGGNAFVAYTDCDVFQAVTEEFLIETTQKAPGIGIAVAAIETDFKDTYKSDFELLNKRIACTKGCFNIPVFAGNQTITKQSGRTGLPVSHYREGEYLSDNQGMKRNRYAAYKKYERNSQIENFDDLAFDKGTDSSIAIIHADGNNMGKDIKSVMDRFTTYEEAVPEIRKLSAKIANCYKDALDRTIEAFSEVYEDYIAEHYSKSQAKQIPEKKKEPPILELINDGDDITLVMGGRFAIDFAVRLLREIEKTSDKNRPFENSKPTACAGVVLFNSHYPFSEAYKLAEELCSSAKKTSREYEGSYIDFHIHQSANVSSLKTLRDHQYKVDGKTILRRPWRVSAGLVNELPNFAWVEENIEAIKKMPRNKTKAIRNAIGAGDQAAQIAINQIRDENLPEFPSMADDKIRAENMSIFAHYFDILEICDDYESLLNKEVRGSVEQKY